MSRNGPSCQLPIIHDIKGHEMTTFKVKDLSAWEDRIDGEYVRVCGRHCVCDENEDNFDLEEKLDQLTCAMSHIPLRPGDVFNKDMLVSFVRDDGIVGLESSMKEPGANVEALSRTKRLFSEIISDMDSLLDKLVETDSLVLIKGEPENK